MSSTEIENIRHLIHLWPQLTTPQKSTQNQPRAESWGMKEQFIPTYLLNIYYQEILCLWHKSLDLINQAKHEK